MEDFIIDRGVATFLAAMVAAVLSGSSLWNSFRQERRVASRKSLETFIFDISSALHEIKATSKVLLTTKAGSVGRKNWTEKAKTAQQSLKNLRPKIRYVLVGVDTSMNVLTRMPDHLLHAIDKEPEYAKMIVERGIELGDSIDRCVRSCYLEGRTPTPIEHWEVELFAQKYLQGFESFKKRGEYEESIEQEVNRY